MIEHSQNQQSSSISDSLAISAPIAILPLVRNLVNGSRYLTPAATARAAMAQNTRTPKTVPRLTVVVAGGFGAAIVVVVVAVVVVGGGGAAK